MTPSSRSSRWSDRLLLATERAHARRARWRRAWGARRSRRQAGVVALWRSGSPGRTGPGVTEAAGVNKRAAASASIARPGPSGRCRACPCLPRRWDPRRVEQIEVHVGIDRERRARLGVVSWRSGPCSASTRSARTRNGRRAERLPVPFVLKSTSKAAPRRCRRRSARPSPARCRCRGCRRARGRRKSSRRSRSSNTVSRSVLSVSLFGPDGPAAKLIVPAEEREVVGVGLDDAVEGDAAVAAAVGVAVVRARVEVARRDDLGALSEISPLSCRPRWGRAPPPVLMAPTVIFDADRRGARCARCRPKGWGWSYRSSHRPC